VTGSELVPAGDRAAIAGGVRRADLLSPALGSLVRRAGGVVSTSIRAGDDRESLRRGFLEAARDSDLLITTGGASMGEADLVKGVLLELGGELEFWGIRMRPGSPVSLGRLPRPERTHLTVLSLPGNPVSAIVTFTLLGIPALRSLGGHSRTFQRTIRGRVRSSLPGPVHLTRFPRVRLVAEGGGAWGVQMSGEDGSGVIRGIAGGDGVAVLPEGAPSPELGEPVEVVLFPGSEWVEAR
jgi:molybdopterin molybdotransferase